MAYPFFYARCFTLAEGSDRMLHRLAVILNLFSLQMHNMKIRTLLAAVLLLLAFSSFAQSETEPEGAYELNEGATKHVLIFSDEYYVHAAFDPKGRTFIGTEGGPFKIEKKNLLIKMEFDSNRKENVDSIFT